MQQHSLTHFAGFRALMLPRLATILHTKDLPSVFLAYRAPKILARDISPRDPQFADGGSHDLRR